MRGVVILKKNHGEYDVANNEERVEGDSHEVGEDGGAREVDGGS